MILKVEVERAPGFTDEECLRRLRLVYEFLLASDGKTKPGDGRQTEDDAQPWGNEYVTRHTRKSD